jgi:hypothetical protein
MNSTFKKKEQDMTTLGLNKEQNPVIFNVYSHTKAVPFTSEKTKIPIPHRIASFYTLGIQNLIIDSNSKRLKALGDEYFQKYKTVVLELPATSEEEYEYAAEVSKEYEANSGVQIRIPKRVLYRKNIYKKYQQHIETKNFIPDSYLSEIKGGWMENIVRLSMRAYNISDSVYILIL